MEQTASRRVRRIKSVHRSNDTEVIDHRAKLRENFADFQSAPSALAELKRRWQQTASLPFRTQVYRVGSLSLEFDQQRLRIEQIDLRGSARHKQTDNVFRFGRDLWTRIAPQCGSVGSLLREEPG